MSGARDRSGRGSSGSGWRWRWPLLLLVAREARPASTRSPSAAGTSAPTPAGPTPPAARKFRPDAFCASPAGADPFDGVHLKSFTRDGQATVSGTRFARWRWDAPPGTGDHPGPRHLVARAPRRDRAAARDDVARPASTPSRSRRPPTPPRASFVAGFSPPAPAFEDRLLCARAETKWCSLEPGSWSALRALTITVEDDGAPGAAIGGDLTGGRLAARRPAASASGATTAAAGSASARPASTAPGSTSPSTPAQKALIGGEWRATRMQPCRPCVSGSTDGRHDRGSATARTRSATARPTSPATSAARRRRTVLIDNNPPAHPRDAGARRRRGLAADRRLRPLLGRTPTRARRARSAAPLADHRARPATTPASSSPPGRDIASLRRPHRPGRRRLHASASGCATKRATTPPRPRSTSRCASTTSRPASPSRRRPTATRGGAAELGPRRCHRRPLGPGERRDRLPPARRRRLDRAADQARAGRRGRTPRAWSRRCRRPRARHLPVPRRRGRRRRQRAPRPRAAPTAPRWRCARSLVAARGAGGGRRSGEDAALRPAALAAPAAAPSSRSRSAPRADPQRPPPRRRRRRPRGSPAAGRLAALARRPRAGSRSTTVRTGEHGGFQLRAARRALAADHGRLRRRGRPRGVAPARLALRVRGGVALARRAERGAGPGRRRPLQRAGPQRAGRRCPGAASWSRSSTTRAPPRRWRPVLVTRSDHGGRFRARYRFRYVSGSGADPAPRRRPRRGALALRARVPRAPVDGPRQRLIGRVCRRCRRRPSTPAPGRSCSSCTTRTRRRPSRTSASSPPTASTTSSSSTG